MIIAIILQLLWLWLLALRRTQSRLSYSWDLYCAGAEIGRSYYGHSGGPLSSNSIAIVCVPTSGIGSHNACPLGNLTSSAYPLRSRCSKFVRASCGCFTGACTSTTHALVMLQLQDIVHSRCWARVRASRFGMPGVQAPGVRVDQIGAKEV